MDTGPISLLKKLNLPDFQALRDQKPSVRLAACGVELLKGICKTRPRVPDDKLMFNKKDINATKNPLAKLFRLIMYKQRITPDDYRTSAIKYGQSLKKTGAEMTTALSNAKKAIMHDNLTVMQLERNLLFANFNILDLGVTIQDNETGEIFEYKLSDIAELQQDSHRDLRGTFDSSMASESETDEDD